MKVTVEKKLILSVLKSASDVVKGGKMLDAFRHVFMEVSPGLLTLSCQSSQGAQFKSSLPATVSEAGSAVVDIAVLTNLLSKLPSKNPVELAVTEKDESKSVTVKQGRRAYSLPVHLFNEDVFKTASFPSSKHCKDSENMLARAMKTALPFADESNTQDNESLSCLLFRADENGLNIAALNGHQFALVRKTHPLAEIMDEDILVNVRLLKPLLKWLTSTKETEIGLDEKRLFFRKKDDGVTSVVSVMRSAFQFPNYESFVSAVKQAESPCVLAVNRNDMAEALARLSIFNTTELRTVIFQYNEETMEFTMRVPGSTVGSGEEVLTADVNGSMPRVAFPTKQLEGVLDTFDSESVEVVITGNNAPCAVVNGDKDSDDGIFTILMPMMLKDEDEEDIHDKAA